MTTAPLVTVGDLQLEAFRLPGKLREAARKKALASNLTFSELMRRALRNELKIFTGNRPFENGGPDGLKINGNNFTAVTMAAAKQETEIKLMKEKI